MSEKQFNARQLRFIEEYLVDSNASQAAIRAGYSAKTARTIATRLLADVHIKARVEELQRERSIRVGCTADSVYREICYLGMSRITDVVEFDGQTITCKSSKELPDHVAAAIAQINSVVTTKRGEVVETKHTIKMHSKTWALDKLSKLMGLDREHCIKAVMAMGYAVVDPNTGEALSFDDGNDRSDDTAGAEGEDQE